jgi:predicted ATP-grasp superfamily ATP-dependent carboligase
VGPPPPALLLGGDQIAVSAARSIAALGADIHAAGDGSDPVQRSRVCSSYEVIPRAKGLSERYLEWLERDGPRGAVLLPCNDESLEVVACNRTLLEEWGYQPVEANDEVILAMLDKERTYELSRAAGVPTPKTATLRTRADAERAAREFDYPCALKPLRSHLFSQIAGMSAKVYLADDAGDLLRWFGVAEEIGIEMLVTEIVPGSDEDFVSYYTYMLPGGQPLFDFTKHKLRQLPIGFGLTCYQETVWEPEVVEVGKRFCQGVGLVGVANVEFKRDARDGTWKIIECNHRFSLANEIVRLSGIDLPAIAYSRVAGLPIEPIRGYRLGVRMWNPIEDALAFRRYRAAGELSFGQWVCSLVCRWHFPMWRLSDPLPTYHKVVRHRLPDLARSGARRLRERLRR